MRTPTSRAEAEAGFTLLELLVVMVILGLAATAVLYAGRGNAETARARAFLIEAEALFREARTAAMRGARETDVVVDTEHRRITLAPSRALDIPAGMDLDASLGDVADAPLPVVRFFPSGSSTGGRLAFQFRGRTYELRVNWLTGRADVQKL